ncbi:hypothetical protein Bbelb_226110 [Branchiostoma belcheri]|nr:hypothetical protein Bbelb_226110 [Branchiostoma belcheri]
MKGPCLYHLYGALPGPQIKEPCQYHLYGALPGPQIKEQCQYHLYGALPALPGPQIKEPCLHHLYGALPGPQMKGPCQYHLYGALHGPQIKEQCQYYLYGGLPGPQMKGPSATLSLIETKKGHAISTTAQCKITHVECGSSTVADRTGETTAIPRSGGSKWWSCAALVDFFLQIHTETREFTLTTLSCVCGAGANCTEFVNKVRLCGDAMFEDGLRVRRRIFSINLETAESISCTSLENLRR